MGTRGKDVSTLEAKTHLAELLRETAKGRSFVIRRRGRPVARLVPPERTVTVPPKELLDAFRAIRESVRGTRGTVHIRELVEEGHRY